MLCTSVSEHSLLGLCALIIVVTGSSSLCCELQKSSLITQLDTSHASTNVQVKEGGQLISGLTESDFVISDEGAPRPVLSFINSSLDVLFLLDTSSSIHSIANQITDSLLVAVQALEPDDRVAIMCFNIRGSLILPLTGDRSLLEKAITTIQNRGTGGNTNFYASLNDAAKYFFKVHRTETPEARLRRASIILMVTDAVGPPSVNEGKLVQQLLEANCTVDTIIVGPDSQQEALMQKAPHLTLQDPVRIGVLTGGSATVVTQIQADLRPIFNRSRSVYTLTFRKTALQVGKLHQVRVELSPRARQQHPLAIVYCQSCDYTE